MLLNKESEIPAEVEELFQQWRDLESQINELEDRRIQLVKEAEERRWEKQQ